MLNTNSHCTLSECQDGNQTLHLSCGQFIHTNYYNKIVQIILVRNSKTPEFAGRAFLQLTDILIIMIAYIVDIFSFTDCITRLFTGVWVFIVEHIHFYFHIISYRRKTHLQASKTKFDHLQNYFHQQTFDILLFCIIFQCVKQNY